MITERHELTLRVLDNAHYLDYCSGLMGVNMCQDIKLYILNMYSLLCVSS